METEDNKPPPPLIVPYEKLSVEALSGLIDEFILREGTDYGAVEVSLESKHAQIFKQLKSGRVLVVFDPLESSCSIVRKEDAPRDLEL
jgi:uncharacterized protein YheU (UPF0270 family)